MRLPSWLESHAEHLNAINVFPVPDGDTGINMSRTLRAAADAASGATGSAADVLAAASRGALLGAAGNSGVILSQMLRGFTEVYATVSVLDGNGLKRALEASSEVQERRPTCRGDYHQRCSSYRGSYPAWRLDGRRTSPPHVARHRRSKPRHPTRKAARGGRS